MEPAAVERGLAAAAAVASTFDLCVEDTVVLHDSNRIAVHLTPCDVVARVGPPAHRAGLALEVDVGHRLARTDAPVAGPDPRVPPVVHDRDGFAITLWTFHEPVPPPVLAAEEYAVALRALHAGMREIEIASPRFSDRVGEAVSIVEDVALSPDLGRDDRSFVLSSLRDHCAAVDTCGAPEQLLHGEPHLGNVLRTASGLRFIDLETCCRGPVEFDIAHGLLPSASGDDLSADAVCAAYPGADPVLVRRCLTLIWAMITAWRWRYDDDLPRRDHWRVEGLARLRALLG